MKIFQISEFKAKCIAVLETVADSRESVLVTPRGRPLARIEPIEEPNRGPGRKPSPDE